MFNTSHSKAVPSALAIERDAMPSLTILTNGVPANPDLWGEEQQRLVRASVCNTFAKLVVLVATKGRGTACGGRVILPQTPT